MEQEKDVIKEVLEKGHLMSLATCDDGGLWVADVVFIFDGIQNLYWMSHPDARHSKAVLGHSQVAGTITISNKSKESNLGIQFSGNAEKIDGANYELARKHYAKRNKPEPKEDEDVLKGHSWYKLNLEKVDIICQEKWGYNKKTLEF